jgi:hypothetical protein
MRDAGDRLPLGITPKVVEDGITGFIVDGKE